MPHAEVRYHSKDNQFTASHGIKAKGGRTNFSIPFFHSFTKYKYAKTPQYFIKVMSYGWFNQRRIEGYGTFPLPQQPGQYTIEVQTWKPITSLNNSLRAFFLGGVDELVSIKTAGYNDSLNKISRIGMQGVNSGTIKIKLNVILHHSHPVIKEKVKIGELSVMDQFQEAKDKLTMLKQNMLPSDSEGNLI